jgi:hypothetical protein
MSAQAYGLLGVTAVPFSPTGAFDALATVTVPSGGTSFITFAGIPNTYTHLQLRYTAKGVAGSAGINGTQWSFNGDVSTSTYTWHYLVGDGSSPAAGGGGTGIAGGNWGEAYADNVTGGIYTAGIMDILDYGNVNKNKTIRHLFGTDLNGSGKIEFFSGSWLNSSTAVNSITWKINGGSTTITQYSTFSLYGVK